VLNVLELKRWNSLRVRALAFTEERGARASLAAVLGVSRQVLHAWLAGKSLPTAEHTLHLRAWVAQAEVEQNKSPGSAKNTARAATQQRKTRESKPKSGRRKK
jgi:hypothetical protein